MRDMGDEPSEMKESGLSQKVPDVNRSIQVEGQECKISLENSESKMPMRWLKLMPKI